VEDWQNDCLGAIKEGPKGRACRQIMPPCLCRCQSCKYKSRAVCAAEGCFRRLNVSNYATVAGDVAVGGGVAIGGNLAVSGTIITPSTLAAGRILQGSASSAAQDNIRVSSTNPNADFVVGGTTSQLLLAAQHAIEMDEIWTLTGFQSNPAATARFLAPVAAASMRSAGLLPNSTIRASDNPLGPWLSEGAATTYNVGLLSYSDSAGYETVPPDAAVQSSDANSITLHHLIPAEPGSVWSVSRNEAYLTAS
jgi:hypothetical protein